MLEAVPPGEQPTRDTPSWLLAGREKITVEERSADKGMSMYWSERPIRMMPGRERTARKSDGVRVSPIVIIISDKEVGMKKREVERGRRRGG